MLFIFTFFLLSTGILRQRRALLEQCLPDIAAQAARKGSQTLLHDALDRALVRALLRPASHQVPHEALPLLGRVRKYRRLADGSALPGHWQLHSRSAEHGSGEAQHESDIRDVVSAGQEQHCEQSAADGGVSEIWGFLRDVEAESRVEGGDG